MLEMAAHQSPFVNKMTAISLRFRYVSVEDLENVFNGY